MYTSGASVAPVRIELEPLASILKQGLQSREEGALGKTRAMRTYTNGALAAPGNRSRSPQV